jgi:cellulose synthase/poly-beta-1,6-N-acetylglucosamine synthase-like glycosyltransferase
MMLSIIITAYKEPRTIGRAIEAFRKQKSLKEPYEILVLCPDKETAEAASRYRGVKVYDDNGKNLFAEKKGKPHALNTAFGLACGDVLVLSDGDVFVDENAVARLLEQMEDETIGAVSGHPIPTNSRDRMLGFWAHFLFEVGAHKRRLNASNLDKFLVASGYLFAFRKGVIQRVPEESLSEDGIISYLVKKAGYKIKYASEAYVYVKCPETFSDWCKQKQRTIAGYEQAKQFFGASEWRNFSAEVGEGSLQGIMYCRNLKELFWMASLAFARLYVWWLAFYNFRLKRKSLAQIWRPVESTK